MTRMCAFPPLGKPVETALTDRRYVTQVVTDRVAVISAEHTTLPAAWDHARELAETCDGHPTIHAKFGLLSYVLIADWAEQGT